MQPESSAKEKVFSIPSHKMSFDLAVKKLIALTPKALNTFMFRFVESLSIVQLSKLESYVKHKKSRLE